MALCSNCNAKIPTIASRLRKVNSELYQLGLEYHDTLSYSLNVAETILAKHGFEGFPVHTLQSFNEGRLHLEVGEGKWLLFTYHQMPSGRYEIVAYVN